MLGLTGRNPVKDGGYGEEHGCMKCQPERTTAEAERDSYFKRKQGDDRLIMREEH